jgi:hypothetical protein
MDLSPGKNVARVATEATFLSLSGVLRCARVVLTAEKLIQCTTAEPILAADSHDGHRQFVSCGELVADRTADAQEIRQLGNGERFALSSR